MTAPDASASAQRRRLIGLGLVIAVAALSLLSDALYARSAAWVAAAADIMDRLPLGGQLLFVLLAAASAMLAFFSSAMLVPVGVSAWGPGTCFVLLWCGWLLGGITAYAIGHACGDALVARLVGAPRFALLRALVARHARLWHIALLQAALPSEIPGYVLGVLRFRFRTYLLALGLSEIPYAFATVFLGTSFLERRGYLMAAAGAFMLLLSAWLVRRYQREITALAAETRQQD